MSFCMCKVTRAFERCLLLACSNWKVWHDPLRMWKGKKWVTEWGESEARRKVDVALFYQCSWGSNMTLKNILKREKERKYRMSMVNVVGFSLRSALTEEKGEKGNCFPFIWPPSLSSATSVSPSVHWEGALLGIQHGPSHKGSLKLATRSKQKGMWLTSIFLLIIIL